MLQDSQAEVLEQIATADTYLSALPSGGYLLGAPLPERGGNGPALEAPTVSWLLREGYLGANWQPTRFAETELERWRKARGHG